MLFVAVFFLFVYLAKCLLFSLKRSLFEQKLGVNNIEISFYLFLVFFSVKFAFEEHFFFQE